MGTGGASLSLPEASTIEQILSKLFSRLLVDLITGDGAGMESIALGPRITFEAMEIPASITILVGAVEAVRAGFHKKVYTARQQRNPSKDDLTRVAD